MKSVFKSAALLISIAVVPNEVEGMIRAARPNGTVRPTNRSSLRGAQRARTAPTAQAMMEDAHAAGAQALQDHTKLCAGLKTEALDAKAEDDVYNAAPIDSAAPAAEAAQADALAQAPADGAPREIAVGDLVYFRDWYDIPATEVGTVTSLSRWMATIDFKSLSRKLVIPINSREILFCQKTGHCV